MPEVDGVLCLLCPGVEQVYYPMECCICLTRAECRRIRNDQVQCAMLELCDPDVLGSEESGRIYNCIV